MKNEHEIICTMTAQQYRAATACTAKNDMRYYLNGIHINSEHVVSTDGHILYLAEIDPGEGFNGPIIFEPVNISTWIRKVVIYTHDSYNVIVETSSNRKGIKTKQHICPLIDGRFPDYKRIIPSDTRFREQFRDFSIGSGYLVSLKTIFGDWPLRFNLSDVNEPIVITHSTESGYGKVVLMPCRL